MLIGISSLVLNAKRETVLRRMIDEDGEKVRLVINSLLKDHVGTLLENRLSIERISLSNFYDEVFAREGLPAGVPPQEYCKDRLPTDAPGLQLLLVQDYCARDAIVQQREKALEAYKSSLEKADAAMVELQSNKANLTSKQLAQKLFSVGEELKKSVDGVRAAFN